jgi:hypothetical protein
VTYLLIFGSVILAGTQAFSQLVIARKHRWGWGVGLLVNLLGMPYEIITRQYGFLVSCTSGCIISLHALHAWKDQGDH